MSNNISQLLTDRDITWAVENRSKTEMRFVYEGLALQAALVLAAATWIVAFSWVSLSLETVGWKIFFGGVAGGAITPIVRYARTFAHSVRVLATSLNARRKASH